MVSLATAAEYDFRRRSFSSEYLILGSEITIEIDMGRSSSVIRRQSGYARSTFSDADDEGSINSSRSDQPRGRLSRRALDLKREEQQTRTESSKFEIAIRRIRRAMSTSPHKKLRSLFLGTRMEKPQASLVPTIRRVEDFDEDTMPSGSSDERFMATWEQHLFHDLNQNHRYKLNVMTPPHSPTKTKGTPCSMVTEIEDTPQHQVSGWSSSNASIPFTRTSGQRLADIVSSSEYDPFIDEEGAGNTAFLNALKTSGTRQTSYQSCMSSGTGAQYVVTDSTSVALHPLNLGFVPALHLRRRTEE